MPNQANNIKTTKVEEHDEEKVESGRESKEENPLKGIDLMDVEGFFDVVSSVPAHKPKNLYDQVKVYKNGNVKKLYIYDYKNNQWIAWNTGSNVASGLDTLNLGTGSTLTKQYDCGFEPKLIKITAAMTSADNGMSWGRGTSTDDNECIYKEPSTSWSVIKESNYIIYCQRNYSGYPTFKGSINEIGSSYFKIFYEGDVDTLITNVLWEAYG